MGLRNKCEECDANSAENEARERQHHACDPLSTMALRLQKPHRVQSSAKNQGAAGQMQVPARRLDKLKRDKEHLAQRGILRMVAEDATRN